MIKLLIGGSPCTYWSIAQNKATRETAAEGLGWELFKNYLIAREKFRPDFILYENNKSAAPAIKEQIRAELGVWGGHYTMLTLAPDISKSIRRWFLLKTASGFTSITAATSSNPPTAEFC